MTAAATTTQLSPLQWAVVAFGLGDLALTLGYLLQLPWATGTWPWPVQPLDYLLVSSFLAGATSVILWIGFTGEWGAVAGASMNVGLMNLGAAIYLFQRWRVDHDGGLLRRAIAFGVFAAINAGAMIWSLRHPIRDRRRVDRFLHVMMGVFTAVLILASVQLLRRSPTIFPWPLEPDTEIMFGWLFLGSAVYFAYGFLRPSWHNTRGQLLAFLAYDLVLIPPYAFLFTTVGQDHVLSLWLYMTVLVFSALLSIYYLFINPRTRRWKIQSDASS